MSENDSLLQFHPATPVRIEKALNPQTHTLVLLNGHFHTLFWTGTEAGWDERARWVGKADSEGTHFLIHHLFRSGWGDRGFLPLWHQVTASSFPLTQTVWILKVDYVTPKENMEELRWGGGKLEGATQTAGREQGSPLLQTSSRAWLTWWSMEFSFFHCKEKKGKEQNKRLLVILSCYSFLWVKALQCWTTVLHSPGQHPPAQSWYLEIHTQLNRSGDKNSFVPHGTHL